MICYLLVEKYNDIPKQFRKAPIFHRDKVMSYRSNVNRTPHAILTTATDFTALKIYFYLCFVYFNRHQSVFELFLNIAFHRSHVDAYFSNPVSSKVMLYFSLKISLLLLTILLQHHEARYRLTLLLTRRQELLQSHVVKNGLSR